MDTHTHTNVCGPPRLFVWAVSAFSSEEKAMDFYESDNPLTSDLPIAYFLCKSKFEEYSYYFRVQGE